MTLLKDSHAPVKMASVNSLSVSAGSKMVKQSVPVAGVQSASTRRWSKMGATQRAESEESVLKELEGLGWQPLDPSTDEQELSEKRVIGNYKGEPITVGFRIEEVEFEQGECLHEVYRTGRYDVHLKIETLGEGLAQGQVKVEEADGYDRET